ncbi:MAG: hypothetical protein FWE31_04645 [Firmicutes bacterium]|nr:hypothetical protein [Bacillota bacterium]
MLTIRLNLPVTCLNMSLCQNSTATLFILAFFFAIYRIFEQISVAMTFAFVLFAIAIAIAPHPVPISRTESGLVSITDLTKSSESNAGTITSFVIVRGKSINLQCPRLYAKSRPTRATSMQSFAFSGLISSVLLNWVLGISSTADMIASA